MAFSIQGLQQMGADGSGPRMWTYASDDTIAEMTAADYFNGAAPVLGARDIIVAHDMLTPETKHIIVGSVEIVDGVPAVVISDETLGSGATNYGAFVFFNQNTTPTQYGAFNYFGS